MRLTLKQAEYVRKEAEKGVSDESLSTELGVSERTIRDCRLGIRYKKAGGPITKRTARGKKRLPDSDIRDMRERASNRKVPFEELANEYDVSPSYVSLVVSGKRRIGAGGPISGPRYYLRK